MPSFRELAVSAGLRASRRISGRPATYTRGASSASLTFAVKRMQQHTTLDFGGSSIVREAVWRIDALEIGALFPPDVGDTITDESGVVFKVECPGENELHWSYTDTGATELTVYTRQNGFSDTAPQNTIDLQGNPVRVA